MGGIGSDGHTSSFREMGQIQVCFLNLIVVLCCSLKFYRSKKALQNAVEVIARLERRKLVGACNCTYNSKCLMVFEQIRKHAVDNMLKATEVRSFAHFCLAKTWVN